MLTHRLLPVSFLSFADVVLFAGVFAGVLAGVFVVLSVLLVDLLSAPLPLDSLALLLVSLLFELISKEKSLEN